MTEPYLILHKVRGEPAFDIAIKLLADKTFLPDEDEIWIIPTSGHRAYPYRYWDLQDIKDVSDINQFGHNIAPIQYVNSIPNDWPDHYSANDRKAPVDLYEVKAKARGLLETLNLVKKVEVERRF